MKGIFDGFDIESESVYDQVDQSHHHNNKIMQSASGDDELFEVFIAYLEPLRQNAAIERLLLAWRSRLGYLALLQEIFKRGECFFEILFAFGWEQFVHEIVLEGAVAVTAHSLFSQFGEGQLRVDEGVNDFP